MRINILYTGRWLNTYSHDILLLSNPLVDTSFRTWSQWLWWMGGPCWSVLSVWVAYCKQSLAFSQRVSEAQGPDLPGSTPCGHAFLCSQLPGKPPSPPGPWWLDLSLGWPSGSSAAVRSCGGLSSVDSLTCRQGDESFPSGWRPPSPALHTYKHTNENTPSN